MTWGSKSHKENEGEWIREELEIVKKKDREEGEIMGGKLEKGEMAEQIGKGENGII